MVLDKFPCFQNNTRLVRYLDTLYKLKVTYNQESLKEHGDCISELTAHNEIEQCFRAVLYMNERNVDLKPIETPHFVIRTRKVPWSFPQKYSNYGFHQHGQHLKTYDFMFELNVSLNDNSRRALTDESETVKKNVLPHKTSELEFVAKDRVPDVPVGRFGRTKEGKLFRVVSSEQSVERVTKTINSDVRVEHKHSENDCVKKRNIAEENTSFVAKDKHRRSNDGHKQSCSSENKAKEDSILKSFSKEGKISAQHNSDTSIKKRKRHTVSSECDSNDQQNLLRRREISRLSTSQNRSDNVVSGRASARRAKNETEETENSINSDDSVDEAQNKKKKTGDARKQVQQTITGVEEFARVLRLRGNVYAIQSQDVAESRNGRNTVEHIRLTKEIAGWSSVDSESDVPTEVYEEHHRRHSRRLNKSKYVHSKNEHVRTGSPMKGKKKGSDIAIDIQNQRRQLHRKLAPHTYEDDAASNVSTDESKTGSPRRRSSRLVKKAKEAESLQTKKIHSDSTADSDCDNEGSPERGIVRREHVRRSRRLTVLNSNIDVDTSPNRRHAKLSTHSAGAHTDFSGSGSKNEGRSSSREMRSRKVKLYAASRSPQVVAKPGGAAEMLSPKVLTVKPVKRAAEVVHRPHTRQMDEESRRIDQLRQQQAHVVYSNFLARRQDRHAVEQAERAETNKLRQLYEPTVPRSSPRKPESSSEGQRSKGQELKLQSTQRVTRKRSSGIWGAIMDNFVTPTKKFVFGNKKNN